MTASSVLDQARDVRAGEELPVDSINDWLKTHLSMPLTGSPKVTQYSGGASNWTYCLSYPERDLILRRAPKGTKAKGAHDMAREFRLQKALKPVFPAVPEMFALCQDPSVLDSDFYIMEKLQGIIPRRNFPKGLSVSEDQARTLCLNMLDQLVQLHEVDLEATGLHDLAKGEGYLDRQLSGWCDRYTKAKTWNVPSAKKVMRWLQENKPTDENICLTHNDFRLDNLVLATDDPTRITGILDWELATLGDPLMDLGNALAYWVEAKDDRLAQATRRQPTHLPGMLTRAEMIETYLAKRGLEHTDFRWYEVFGLFRLAGIAQQIYYRYHHKQTRNPAFKNFWFFVHYLLWRSKKAMRT
ncbi:phosphotransferase family protein [Reinekea blandensis]|uniref:Predicted aminoglycoside phosphotransferase n=1 Tax=Reinekea blandensis MED297 TaxID=314283 RepID=A4BGV7_9GAMM|nr:phosphotransferase family protein [Reinekea blandensis]EAR08603.1 Predicted aminoglycoside phosphotransferase [Reinekea sp. MED297] [Reinekea blandensis MED297]